MASKFDRVKAQEMGRKVMKDMDDPKSPWSKEKAIDMVSRFGTGGLNVVGAASKFVKSLKGKKPVSKIEKMEVEAQNAKEAAERPRMRSYGYGTEARIKTSAGKDKGSSRSTFYQEPTTSEKLEKLRFRDEVKTAAVKSKSPSNAKYRKENTTTESGFTTRGKPIGKKIGDQGGSPSAANKAKREKMGDDAKFYRQAAKNRQDIKRWGKREYGK